VKAVDYWYKLGRFAVLAEGVFNRLFLVYILKNEEIN